MLSFTAIKQSCNYLHVTLFSQNVSAGLVQLIKPTLREQEIPEFLWKHLEKDLTLLGRALGRSVDEAVLVIHLVLQDILVKDIPKSKLLLCGILINIFFYS